MDELIKPNWHIALVHFPIALLTMGILIEVFSFLGWRRSSFRAGGKWMLLLGGILSVPATFSGLYAMSTVIPGGLFGLDKTSDLYETAWDHLWMLSAATGGAMFLITFWIACADVWRDRLSLFFKLGLLTVLGLTLVGAHHGGDLVYGFKTGVHGNGASIIPTSLPAGDIDVVLDEALIAEQGHVVMSGFALALACVCLGLSLRAVAQNENARAVEESHSLEHIASAFSVPGAAVPATLGQASHQVAIQSVNHTRPAKFGRFWLLTVLLIAVSAVGGLWTLSRATGIRDVNELINIIRSTEDGGPQITRRMVHTVAGVGLLADAILLMFASVIARRSKLVVVALAAPMILFIAIQVWMGILLVMEGHEGRITGFGPISSAEPTSQPASLHP